MGDVARIRTELVDDDRVADFCRRHGITRLAVFGSELSGDAGPASDVDLLVEFASGRTPGLLGLASMELELEAIVGREIELRTHEDLSRYFRDEVRERAAVVYGAA